MTDTAPQFEFHGLRFYASRDGDRVTGRVVFPYRTSIGDQSRIDYRRTDPPPPDGATASPKAAMRLEAVHRYQTLVESAKGRSPKLTKRNILIVTATICEDRFSPRTLQSWVRKYELEGANGLEDKHAAAPKSVLECTADQAKDALLVCGWWTFRIGNAVIVDTKMMHAALALVKHRWSTADLLAIIDCYYSWSCDRERFPFKPFARWCRYDIDTWALRAADRNDYRRAAFEAGRKEQVALRDPIKSAPSTTPPPKQRFRETADRRTRQSIRKLAGEMPSENRATARSRLPTFSPAHPDSPATMQSARALNRLGFTGASRSIAADLVTTGPTPLAATTDPETMAEALGLLEDRWRLMLIRASQGDRDELDAATATINLWWDAMPKTLRSNIDACSKQWRIEHPTVPDATCDRRRVMQILVHLRRRSGAQRLAVALRLPT